MLKTKRTIKDVLICVYIRFISKLITIIIDEIPLIKNEELLNTLYS